MATPVRLETDRLIVRDLEAGDIPALHAIFSDRAVTQYMDYVKSDSLRKTTAKIGGWMRDNRATPRHAYIFSVIEKASGRIAGWIGFGDADREKRQIGQTDFGYAFGKEWWNKGYATECLRAVVRFAFERVGTTSFWGECDRRNPASGRVMEKCGLIRVPDRVEGRHRYPCYRITRAEWQRGMMRPALSTQGGTVVKESRMQFLKVRRNLIVDEEGREVRLRGYCVGGWMNLENFINGYPGHPQTFRAALERELGQGRTAFFFDRMMDHFLSEDDIRYMASLGVNTLRVPFNYRHFEDDAKPFDWKPAGFRRLDWVIDACGRNGIRVILDLHAAQGWQNPDWHSDNPTNLALLWSHPHFQDRVVGLWEELAKRYRRNPAVAGYNFLNEPVCGVSGGLPRLYRRLAKAVRKHDSNHIFFLEGNAFSRDFSEMGEVAGGNTVFSNHTYPTPGLELGRYPGRIGGVAFSRATLKRDQERGTAFMMRNHLPVWTGEFGAIFRGTPRDADRLRVVEDCISVFNELEHHWTIWTWKDIGMMGTVHLSPESPWMKLTARYRDMMVKLGSQTWGQLTGSVVARSVTGLGAAVRREAAHRRWPVDPASFAMPFGLANRMIGGMLVSEMLLPAYAALFRGKSEKQLDLLLQSFAFRNCVIRSGLARAISRGCAGG